MKRKTIYYALYMVFLLLLMEPLAWFGLTWLSSRGIKVAYAPQRDPEKYKVYLAQRDTVLGWPSPAKFGGAEYDSIGARPCPSCIGTGHKSCVSLYGDSYTYSVDLDNNHAWGNLLARKMNCRVNNFGAGGYGTDQSYLRFLQNKDDSSGTVILSHMSENIVRNVNQFRDYLYSTGGFGFKPRFILDGESKLKLIGLPKLSKEEYLDFFKHPKKYLKYDYLVPGGEGGQQFLRFPFLLRFVRMFSHIRIQSKLKELKTGHTYEYYFDFYNPDHPSNALKITAGIMKNFTLKVMERKQKPVLAILPAYGDLMYFRETGNWPFNNLIQVLEAEQIAVLNVGEKMSAAMDGQDLSGFFTQNFAHYNEIGDSILAGIMFRHLNPN